jgi:phosphoglycolate phosphatase-like HAD superfamily hydrolase
MTKQTIVFDIDGVLADNSDYYKYFINGDFNPELFKEDIENIKINKYAKQMIKSFEDNSI